MLLTLLALDHHVINVNLRRIPDLIFEHPGNHLLVCGSCIMIISLGRYEGSLLLVLGHKGNLVISLKSVQETHPWVSVRGIYQVINFRYWEGVPRASSVKVGKINADPPLSIHLFHHYCI